MTSPDLTYKYMEMFIELDTNAGFSNITTGNWQQ